MHFQVMAKPAGASCNLDCSYCFYKEKQGLYPAQPAPQMPFEVLESYIRQTIEGQSGSEYHFAWQGGEPTLLGIDYFKKIVSLQERYVGGARIKNTIQTNGTLLTDSWCSFFKEHGFLVGLSIDGPRALHDKYRCTRQGQSSFDKVLVGVELLKKHQVPFNTLTVVNDSNSREPLKVYNFLKKIGDGHMQFIPAVERSADQKARQLGLKLARPPSRQHQSHYAKLMPWSVKPEQLATFYLTIFHEWVERDVGRVFVQFFDVALGNWLGAGSGLCHFAPTCGQAGALEYNGDLYSCDHYVYPRHRLGNIMETPLAKLLGSARQEEFGKSKKDDLPEECRQCAVRRLCHGDCSKHRFVIREGSNTGISYLCPAYKKIFTHLAPYLEIMARLLHGGRPVSEVMALLANQSPSRVPGSPGRNAACSCGSGQKYKKCCGKHERMR